MKNENETSQTKSGVVSRQLALAFSLVTGVAIVMCVALEVMVVRLAASVDDMRRDEEAIGASFRLATAVREQYIHQAHSIIVGDRSHLGHYGEWVNRVAEASNQLGAVSDAPMRESIVQIQRLSRDLDERFAAAVVPRLDRPSVLRELTTSHEELERLSLEAIHMADELVRTAEAGISHRHVSATSLTRFAMAIGGVCMALVVLLALASTLRLRRALLLPLARLTQAAQRFGEGRFDQRLGQVGTGELQALADAFDTMVVELKERQQRLLQKERLAVIGQIAAGVAHEVNNPIAVIRGYLKTMSAEQLPAQLDEELQILDEEAAACQRIVEDLLAYSEVPRLSVRRTALDQLIRETVVRLAEASHVPSSKVVVEAQPAALSIDPDRIRQVLINLIKNALAAVASAQAVRVIGTQNPDGSYRICVIDAGPGVPPQDRQRIFEPFVGGRRGGTGLGLAICRAIVDAHGGSIRVEPAEPRGARFVVTLPAEPPEET